MYSKFQTLVRDVYNKMMEGEDNDSEWNYAAR